MYLKYLWSRRVILNSEIRGIETDWKWNGRKISSGIALSKTLARYRSENNFAYCQNDFTERLNITSNAVKSFDILTAGLNVLHNYFDGPNKIILDLYLVKFLDTSAKLSFRV